jgi:ATP-dependent DNA helicase RecG
LSQGRKAVFFGTLEREKGGLAMKNPEHELLDPEEERDPVHMGRIVGIYRRVAEVSGKWQRRLIANALELVTPELKAATDPAAVATALGDIHFPAGPDPAATAARARRVVAREELTVFCDAVEGRRARRRAQTLGRGWTTATLPELTALLPFPLTGAQERAIGEIAGDLRRPYPMARLLQGDVGSGKTAVALIAALLAAENGRQAGLMVPTEILAEQHAETVGRWLSGTRFRVALLTGRTKEAARRHLRAALKAGEVDLLIGTHALIERPIEFRDLGLAIVDEQHRFGVAHRARFSRKGDLPHVLVLTATPIPRSLAWTLFGDLDVSVLDEKPPGRALIRTHVRGPDRRDKVYRFLGERVAAGERGYVVVPAIEESELDIAAAEKTLEDVRAVLPEARIELLHGKLPPERRQAAMRAFAAGDLDVLVATTVIEVGLDVPEATVLVVENAERFGLSQLHQLRGRIGRGPRASHCILIASEKAGPEAEARLKALEETSDGFRIAELDLSMRGPGDLLGLRQAGLPAFRVADPIADLDLLREVRDDVRRRRGEGASIESDLFPAGRAVIETAR